MGRGTTETDQISARRDGLGRIRSFELSTVGLQIELERTGLEESCAEADVVTANGRPWVRSLKLLAPLVETRLEGFDPIAEAEQILKAVPDGGGQDALSIVLRAYNLGFRAGHDKDRTWED